MKPAKGLKFEDIRIGRGHAVEAKDIVHVHCVCSRPKGDIVFDTHTDAPYQFRVGSRECYVGLEQAVVGMQVGGVRKVKVPPHLAYREREQYPTLPQDAMLLYQIELLRIPKQWDNTLHIRHSPTYSTKAKVLAHLHRILPVSSKLRSPYQIVQQALFQEAEKNRLKAEKRKAEPGVGR